MQGWLWLLVWAAFFYFMMRFGCGAHMIHGGHGGHNHGEHGKGEQQQPSAGSATDPVCGMSVASAQGYSEAYQGRQYHFCSRQCLDKFDAEPQRYIS
jgi:YHS domain-containing protein